MIYIFIYEDIDIILNKICNKFMFRYKLIKKIIYNIYKICTIYFRNYLSNKILILEFSY